MATTHWLQVAAPSPFGRPRAIATTKSNSFLFVKQGCLHHPPRVAGDDTLVNVCTRMQVNSRWPAGNLQSGQASADDHDAMAAAVRHQHVLLRTLQHSQDVARALLQRNYRCNRLSTTKGRHSWLPLRQMWRTKSKSLLRDLARQQADADGMQKVIDTDCTSGVWSLPAMQRLMRISG